MAPHDPTRAGPPTPAADGPPVRLSLPEIESLCLKAARGAGRDWGLAEEAGWAAAWLAARGLPGPELMLAWLCAPPGAAPLPQPGTWTAATDAALCPVATGAALADFAGLPEGDPAPELRLAPVRVPTLLLPFLARVAAQRGTALRIEGAGGTVVVTPQGELAGELAPQAGAEAIPLRLAPAPPPATAMAAPPNLTIDRTAWRRLDAFALATTVPPSDRSRAGAGAGGTDND